MTFPDIGPAPQIAKWAEYGLVKGSGGSFRPDDPVTRAEMAVILTNLMGYQSKADNTFSDISSSAWYSDAILKASAVGVLSGDGKGHALPSANITREQAASMLARAFSVDDGTKSGSAFKDADSISGWAAGAVFGMEADKYIGGMGNGDFVPKSSVTRRAGNNDDQQCRQGLLHRARHLYRGCLTDLFRSKLCRDRESQRRHHPGSENKR